MIESARGIIIIPEFINKHEENLLLQVTELFPGKDKVTKTTPNRMFRFGEVPYKEGLINDTKLKDQGYKNPRRSYGEMNDGIDVSVKHIPFFMDEIGLRLVDLAILDKVPSVYVINKYNKGTGIGRHIDHDDNGPVIPVVGLQSEATMVLTRPNHKPMEFIFPRRSLVVLTKESRYEWFHEILPVKEQRHALVFRNL